jgi:hypothetical protein
MYPTFSLTIPAQSKEYWHHIFALRQQRQIHFIQGFLKEGLSNDSVRLTWLSKARSQRQSAKTFRTHFLTHQKQAFRTTWLGQQGGVRKAHLAGPYRVLVAGMVTPWLRGTERLLV